MGGHPPKCFMRRCNFNTRGGIVSRLKGAIVYCLEELIYISFGNLRDLIRRNVTNGSVRSKEISGVFRNE